MVRIRTGSYVAIVSDEASQQLRGRLLAARLESLSDQLADLEPGAIIASLRGPLQATLSTAV
jgi:hypothetical protein